MSGVFIAANKSIKTFGQKIFLLVLEYIRTYTKISVSGRDEVQFYIQGTIPSIGTYEHSGWYCVAQHEKADYRIGNVITRIKIIYVGFIIIQEIVKIV